MADINSIIRLVGDASSVINMYNQLIRADQKYRQQVSQPLTGGGGNLTGVGAAIPRSVLSNVGDVGSPNLDRTLAQYAAALDRVGLAQNRLAGIQEISKRSAQAYNKELARAIDSYNTYYAGVNKPKDTNPLVVAAKQRVAQLTGQVVPGADPILNEQARKITEVRQRTYTPRKPRAAKTPIEDLSVVKENIEQLDTYNKTLKTSATAYAAAAREGEKYQGTVSGFSGDLSKVAAAEGSIARARRANTKELASTRAEVEKTGKSYERLVKTLGGKELERVKKNQEAIAEKAAFTLPARRVERALKDAEKRLSEKKVEITKPYAPAPAADGAAEAKASLKRVVSAEKAKKAAITTAPISEVRREQAASLLAANNELKTAQKAYNAAVASTLAPARAEVSRLESLVAERKNLIEQATNEVESIRKQIATSEARVKSLQATPAAPKAPKVVPAGTPEYLIPRFNPNAVNGIAVGSIKAPILADKNTELVSIKKLLGLNENELGIGRTKGTLLEPKVIDALVKEIETSGFIRAAQLSYNQSSGTAAFREQGSHLIEAAKRVGLESIPVTVVKGEHLAGDAVIGGPSRTLPKEFKPSLLDIPTEPLHVPVVPEVTKPVAQAVAQSLGYHAGDLSYGKDTTLERMTAGRGTGHFGTGVYFTSSPDKIGPLVKEGRPIQAADLSGYNLLRPKTEAEGFALHDALKIINNGIAKQPTKEDAIRAYKTLAAVTGKTNVEVQEAIVKTFKDLSSPQAESIKKSKGFEDSASTRVLKNLGYEGVDVRHLSALDNSDYGSVVFGRKVAAATVVDKDALAKEQENLKQLKSQLKDKTSALAAHTTSMTSLTGQLSRARDGLTKALSSKPLVAASRIIEDARKKIEDIRGSIVPKSRPQAAPSFLDTATRNLFSSKRGIPLDAASQLYPFIPTTNAFRHLPDDFQQSAQAHLRNLIAQYGEPVNLLGAFGSRDVRNVFGDSRSAGAWALPARRQIEFNQEAVARMSDFLKKSPQSSLRDYWPETFAHEYGHLLDYQIPFQQTTRFLAKTGQGFGREKFADLFAAAYSGKGDPYGIQEFVKNAPRIQKRRTLLGKDLNTEFREFFGILTRSEGYITDWTKFYKDLGEGLPAEMRGPSFIGGGGGGGRLLRPAPAIPPDPNLPPPRLGQLQTIDEFGQIVGRQLGLVSRAFEGFGDDTRKAFGKILADRGIALENRAASYRQSLYTSEVGPNGRIIPGRVVSRALGQEVGLGQGYVLDASGNPVLRHDRFRRVGDIFEAAVPGPDGTEIQKRFVKREALKKGIASDLPYIREDKPPVTEFDHFNRTLKTTTELYKRLEDGTEVLHSTQTAYHGDLDKLAVAERRIGETLGKNAEATAAYREQYRELRNIQRTAENQYVAPARQGLQAADAALARRLEFNEAGTNVRRKQREIAALERRTAPTDVVGQEAIANARAELAQLESVLAAKRAALQGDYRSVRQLTAQMQTANAAYTAALQTPAVVAAKRDVQAFAGTARGQLLAQNEARLAEARAARVAALTAEPPIAQVFQTIPEKPLQKLAKLLPPGSLNNPEIAENIQLRRDLIHNVTEVSGYFRDEAGVLNSVSLAYDKAGNVITKFGGHLSGLQNAIKQTVANMTKVVYWTAATTAILGSLGFVAGSIGNLVELDKILNRLSVTAQLTTAQTRVLFEGLADVAYQTATPLNELVSAADDIALATRKAGQSTAEWQGEILGLGRAVGILTNLTGLDTVKATDLLTSTMKQLDLSSTDLITVLNKVTAVGGGQSVAIADIVEGLGQMAEAASTSGLSLDETIATVQVLSQVTSKSSKEVATSFKNLTGSLGGKAAGKALAKLDIPLKDVATGELRNIVDIYRDVNTALQTGKLAASDLQETLRALAGGPRRLPDAAALLNAIPQIDEVTKKSASASNEALLANAKVLDTLQAKITQLSVKFQETTFSRFGEGLKEAGASMIDVLTLVLGVLEKIPSGVYATIIQFGAFLAITKLASGGIRYLAGVLGEVAVGFAEMTGAAIGATNAIRGVSAASAQSSLGAGLRNNLFYVGGAPIGPKPKPSRSAKFGGLAALAAQGAIGVGFGGGLVNEEGINLSGIGGGLQALGGAALFEPVPIPHIKAFGAAAFALGTALSLIGGSAKKSETDLAGLRQVVLENISTYETAAETVRTLRTQQNDLLEKYGNQTKTLGQAKTPKEKVQTQNLLDSTLKEYGDVTKQLADANAQLTESFYALDKAMAKTGTAFGAQVNFAKTGVLNKEELKKLSQNIATQIFAQQDESFALELDASGKIQKRNAPPQFQNLPTFGQGEAGASFQQLVAPPAGRYPKAPPITQLETVSLNAGDLQTDKVLKLFDLSQGKFVGTLNQTSQTIDVITAQLTEMAAAGDANAEAALKIFQAYVAVNDQLSNTNQFVEFQKRLAEAQELIGTIGPEQAKSIRENADLFQKLIESSTRIPEGTGGLSLEERDATGFRDSEGVSISSRQKVVDRLKGIFLNGEGNITGRLFNVDEARQMLTVLGATKGLQEAGIELNDKNIAILAESLGIHTNISTEMAKQIKESEELTEILADLNDIRDKNLDSLADKKQDIMRQYLSGDITAKERDSLFAGAEGTKTVQDDITGFFESIANNQEALDNFEGQLARIPGLENLVGANAAEAASIMSVFFANLDLTGKGANALIGKIAGLIAALDAIPEDVRTNITLAIQTRTAKNINDDPRYAYAITHGNERLAEQIAEEYRKANEAQAKGEVAKANNSLNQLIKLIQGIGSGRYPSYTNLGPTPDKLKEPKPPTPPDVSTLDLPEEIANAANRSALIAEAVKRARALQAKIPGANKEASNDIVELLKGTQRILEVRGVKDDLLRKALEELAAIEKKKLEFETKADLIRRIRVGGGDFAAIANVPLNSKTGVSLGGPNGINITLNVNGQVTTPAQLSQLADMIAAALKRQIANG